MILKALLNQLKTEHKITGVVELAALLAQDKALLLQIKQADAQYWVNFSKQTFDGWYCVATPSNASYHVYYQERGQHCWGEEVFSDQYLAIASVIFASGLFHAE
ncbi:cytoplasmic protein [Shewanella xiamenensis]|uniref:cytoplasmic protein n=1 Tax=Shewanella xiamenensis TaxID=332186 RepID=UPI00084994B4|nr:cytoplasmic protein [Shewanella xiamenensis]ODR88013.1 cytoplasmic protein [Shewanella xiamenensis]